LGLLEGLKVKIFTNGGALILKMNRCIPYRYTRKGSQDKELEVLVISAQKGNGMQFPKVFIVFNYLEFRMVNLECDMCLDSGRLGERRIHGTGCCKGEHRGSWSRWKRGS